MDMKNNGSAYRRIKGFTLVELIIVMAIIVILAGIMSLVTQSFVRNARRETANDTAQLLFTGFQNVLTQCEIKQDSSAFAYDSTNLFDLGRVIVSVKAYSGNIQVLKVENFKSDGTDIGAADVEFTSGGLEWDTAKVSTYKGDLSKLANVILGVLDANSSFEGEAKIYIDYENFEVKSVVYKTISDDSRNQTLNDDNFADGDLTGYGGDSSDDWWYYGYGTRGDQETAMEQHPLYGVYPFQDALTT